MCGIAGHISWHESPAVTAVQRMTEALLHRGPDAGGLWHDDIACFGHRRLAIIDPGATSNQPYTSSDGRCVLTYNGEIYNFRDIRQTLEGLGRKFQTQGDVEVLIEAYLEWGTSCLEHFNGMFAFAIWDKQSQSLFMARDRFGEKPLYYTETPDSGLVFASELGALRQHPATSKRISGEAIGHYLSLGYTLTSQAALAGVKKLHPGHYLLLERGKSPRTACYWELKDFYENKPAYRSRQDAAEQLAALLDDAVSSRMISDVPLGAFLSGGVDSSIVVEAMKRLNPSSTTKTYSIKFPVAAFDESDKARDVANLLGAEFTASTVDSPDADTLETILQWMDEPFCDTSLIPMYFLSEVTRKHVTVSLSGDGSDELFAGYPTYHADQYFNLIKWMPKQMQGPLRTAAELLLPVRFEKIGMDYKARQFIGAIGLPPASAHFWWRTLFSQADKREMLSDQAISAGAMADPIPEMSRHYDALNTGDRLDRALYADAKTWLVDDILYKVDRTTMAHSLEARCPFLDHRLAEFAAGLPSSWKLRAKGGKAILADARANLLPSRVFKQKKEGFNAPVSAWLAGPLREYAKEATSSTALNEWVRSDYIAKIWKQHDERTQDHGLRLFALVCMGQWLSPGSKGNA